MPELRIDPIVGRRVYVAEDRAGRPNDFPIGPPPSQGGARGGIPERRDSPTRSRQARAGCPFCAGHESLTPEASATALDAAGRWQVRVVPNKYPAVSLDEPASGAFGAHEVIVESPSHALELTELGAAHLTAVLTMFRDRLRHWSTDGRLKHGLVFKNSGAEAGASLEHVHSQLVALPYVPAAVQAELDAVARFRQQHGRCILCELVERELAAGERVVFRRDGYAALCPVAPRQPYEIWLLPERHAARLDALGDDELAAQAVALDELLRRLQAVSPGAAYNLLLHAAPFAAPDAAFHWHWELIPRLTHEAGLERGGGVHITPLSPERAAASLRDAF